MTPETSGHPLSPTASLTPPEAQFTPSGQPQSRYSSSHISFDIEIDGEEGDPSSSSPQQHKTHKTLFLLSRSRGVQTDGWHGLPSPSPLPSYISSPSPHDLRSDTSSFSETLTSDMSLLLERIVTLLGRMVQADALTLTNRLKRQNLKGADVRHLSRSTVNSIVSEATGLRTQFRVLIEDEKVIANLTRKDLRIFFKVIREFFSELGQMRTVLNDIILDPAIAARVSELALDPVKAEVDRREKGNKKVNGNAGSNLGWMAPLSKLFGAPSGRDHNSGTPSQFTRATSAGGTARPPPRFVPKAGAALSASATNVNVEFSGSGVGRSMTSTSSAQPARARNTDSPTSIQGGSPAVMNIFAGAPQVVPATPDPWIVVPRTPRRTTSFIRAPNVSATTTIGRSFSKNGGGPRLSRNVDAVIDVERPVHADDEPDYLGPLLERTLRRRGLSDSSIHSTFASHADDPVSPAMTPSMTGVPSRRGGAWADQVSVLQSLSRTVQNFRLTASGAGLETGSEAGTLPPPFTSSSHSQLPSNVGGGGTGPTTSPGIGNLLPKLSSWAAVGGILDSASAIDPFVVGNSSVRDESFLQRTRRPGESHGRDYY